MSAARSRLYANDLGLANLGEGHLTHEEAREGRRSDRAAVGPAGIGARSADQLDRGVAVPPRAVEELAEHLGRLCARDAVPLVDDEERDAGRAVGPGLVD